ncbi:ATP synthase F1 subunit delta [Henriciella aquimarina]|uniref:ATP synthase F1 subunit delta n=1 Tax=Henriciella aquimarina TaxID=545261 RepID=UPI000A020915|nr:ATP synthase F1 subunit delta [Henriciella aquimarina]
MAASSASHANETARRYASALFDLAEEKGALETVATDLKDVLAMAKGSKDLTLLLESPAFGREEKAKALVALADKAGLGKLVSNFLATMASNGRSDEILDAAGHFDELYARHRGVKRAIARTAEEMTAEQRQKLEAVLAKAVGSDIELETEVVADLIGGIQLRVGSTLIDASVASKLDRMNTAMKGA